MARLRLNMAKTVLVQRQESAVRSGRHFLFSTYQSVMLLREKIKSKGKKALPITPI